MNEFDWSNISLDRTDNECRECGWQVFNLSMKIARKISKDYAQVIVNCENCGTQGVIIETIYLHPECIEKPIIPEKTKNFIDDLKKLMNRYDVEINYWNDEGEYYFVSKNEESDENFISVSIADGRLD